MTGTTGKALTLLGAIFVLGMIAGASLFYLGQRSVGPDRSGRRPPADQGQPRGPLEDMTRRLELTEDQQARISEILDRYRTQMDGMLEQSRLEIREVLTEQQREAFDAMRPPRRGPGPGGRPPHDRRPPPPGGRRKAPPPPGRPPPGQ